MKMISHNVRTQLVPQPCRCNATASRATWWHIRCHSIQRRWDVFRVLLRAVLNPSAPSPAIQMTTPISAHLWRITCLQKPRLSNRLNEAHGTESLQTVGRERKQGKQWNRNKSTTHFLYWRNNVFSKLHADLFPFSYSLPWCFFFFFLEATENERKRQKSILPCRNTKIVKAQAALQRSSAIHSQRILCM